MEFVVVSGPVGTPHDDAKLAAEMDDYGEEGYITVSLSTVVYGGGIWATIVMERAVEDEDEPCSHGVVREFPVIDGGAS